MGLTFAAKWTELIFSFSLQAGCVQPRNLYAGLGTQIRPIILPSELHPVRHPVSPELQTV